MTKRCLIGVAVFVAEVAVLMTPAPVLARPCANLCGTAARTAISSAQATRRSCRLECGTAADPHACRLACQDALRQARAAAKIALMDCRERCSTWTGCESECLAPAGDCLAAIPSQIESCAFYCGWTARSGASGCIGKPNLVSCLEEVAQDTLSCAGTCATYAIDNVAACGAKTHQCTVRCPAPPPSVACRRGCLWSVENCVVDDVAHPATACVEGCGANAVQAAVNCIGAADIGDCLASLAPEMSQCALGCKTDAEGGAGACRTDFNDCMSECPADPCRDNCVGTLKDCAEPLLTDAATCAKDCVTATVGSVSCGLDMSCLSGIANQLSACAHQCLDPALSGGAACKDAYVTCHQQCS